MDGRASNIRRPPELNCSFTTAVPTIEEGLQRRIRSLLHSRNASRPPRAPCPSPDFKLARRTTESVFLPRPEADKSKSDWDRNDSTLATCFLNMASLSSDRRSSHPSSPDCRLLNQPRRPGTENGRHYSVHKPSLSDSERQLDTEDSPFVQKLPDKNTMRRSDSVKARPPPTTRSPHYPLRVVPPKRTSSMDLRAFHVPGSYKSEIRTGTPSTPSTPKPTLLHHDGNRNPDLEHKSQRDPSDAIALAEPEAKPQATATGSSKINTMGQSSADEDVVRSEARTSVPGLHECPSQSSSLRTISMSNDDDKASLLPAPLRGSSMEPSAKESVQASPISRAMSMLSELSGRRHSLPSSSISVTTNQRRGSAARPSDINYKGTPVRYASVTHSENRENDQRTNWMHQLIGKAAPTTCPPSNLTARPSQRRTGESDKLRARTMPHAGSQGQVSGHFCRQSTEATSFPHRQRESSAALSQVVLDLENLLKEALSIAGQAASRGPTEEVTMLQDKIPPPQHDQPLPADAAYRSSSTSSISSLTGEEDPILRSVPQRKVAVQEPENDIRKQESFKEPRDATPWPAQSTAATSHQSTAPPTTGALPVGKQQVEDGEKESNKMAPNTLQEPLRPNTKMAATEPPVRSNDWAYNQKPVVPPPPAPQTPLSVKSTLREEYRSLARNEGLHGQQRPPLVQPQSSSAGLHNRKPHKGDLNLPEPTSASDSDSDEEHYVADFKNDGRQYHPVYQEAMAGEDRGRSTGRSPDYPPPQREDTIMPLDNKEISMHSMPQRGGSQTEQNDISLKDRSHLSIREPRGFSLSRSHRRRPIARDWDPGRKRFVATVSCITTTLLGLILGIYAGEVPALQYALADEHHYTILGNVVFFLGMALTTILAWPLPVLHGRKTYTMAALVLLMPLQFPQALAVAGPRTPYVATYRVGVLVPRAISGLVMGFANVNFMSTLLDLFGASLQSRNPHQEAMNENDVRRHGGGMGVWLGISTWCSTMSIGVGFLIGACIISGLNVSWGFWITTILCAAVLLLNVITPETRRSPYRRSMAEVRTGTDISRRVARGEIKMHMDLTGPRHWYEEPLAGYRLCLEMLKQPGFLILAFYQGWIYGQIVLIISLLGALLSKYYYFHPQYVGLGVLSIPIGALFAVPFQKANLFSRARQRRPRTDSMTFEKRVTWTSHLVRRSIFSILLPFAGLAYTLSSNGRVHFMAPIIFAGLIGFLSNLAIAECNGLIMETFDTSDLQPGMTGRPRRVLPEDVRRKRTNFSSFPRVTAGFAVAQSFSFVVAAVGTGVGGVLERNLGAREATGVVAGILLVLTLLLFAVLWRFKVVQIIPSQRFGTTILAGPEDEWKPIIIGSPSGTTRRMNVLELGKMSRWTEIRRRNRLGSI